MELTAVSISTLSQKTKYQYCHCTGKIPWKLLLTEFPSSEHILWHENEGVVFAKRRKKRPKCNNNAQKYTRNENFLTIFLQKVHSCVRVEGLPYAPHIYVSQDQEYKVKYESKEMTLETILLQMYNYLALLFYSKVANKMCSVNNVFGQF